MSTQPTKKLKETLTDAIGRCLDTLIVNEEVMEDEDIKKLRTTIDDLQYYRSTL